MTTKEKEMLIMDICSRIPYSVKVHFKMNETYEKINNIIYVEDGEYTYMTNGKSYLTLDILKELLNNHLDFCKPYLYPITSINEEQQKELYKLGWYVDGDKIYSRFRNYDEVNYKTHTDSLELVNWCYKNHIDINGLIPMGLAINATNLKE